MPITRLFRKKIATKLNDAAMRRALKNFGNTYPSGREAAFQGKNFDELRDQIVIAKAGAAADIEHLADRFEKTVTARGGMVHRAATGAEAVAIIRDIAQRRNATTCVKSKSMTSEEIELNHELADTMRMVETDLGEWIIQQLGEKPSHMVLPAIHLSKEQCAEVFSKATGKTVPPDIPAMVKLARGILRREFLKADIGISGCNIAVAETGTMVLFTNEGNARLTSTLPPVHIVLFGYEKLVASFTDIAPIATTLPRNATGQLLTSYMTLISGPVETFTDADGSGIGGKEFHVILLDNGRLPLLRDPVFGEIGRCIRCAACLNVCPVYQMVSGHVYGHIYSGGIGALLTYFFNTPDDAEKIQELCLSCGKCREICSARIDIPELIFRMRALIRRRHKLPFLQNLFIGTLLPSRRLFSLALGGGSLSMRFFSRPGLQGRRFMRDLPFGITMMAASHRMPALARVPFARSFKKIRQDSSSPAGTIALFGGCLVDRVYPDIAASIVSFFNAAGYRIIYPRQTCCGAPAFYMGRPDITAALARQNLKALADATVDWIISACPTCTESLARRWCELLHDDPVWKEKAHAIAEKTHTFIGLTHKLGLIADTTPTANNANNDRSTFTYHDSCHMKRSLGIASQPREAIARRTGLALVEMEQADRCCGFAGTYSIKLPEISDELLNRKLDAIEASGASMVAMDCPGCLFMIQGGLENRKSGITACHTATLIALAGHKDKPKPVR